MKTKITKISNTQKDLSHLMTRPFSNNEKEGIRAARQKSGLDRPSFYHDAIVDYANKINGDKNA